MMTMMYDEGFRWKYATDADFAARINQIFDAQRREQDAQRKAEETERIQAESENSKDTNS